MMVIRDIFFCKPGKVRQMVDKFKAMNVASAKMGMPSGRIMTDLSAERYWTVVLEWDVKSGQFIFRARAIAASARGDITA